MQVISFAPAHPATDGPPIAVDDVEERLSDWFGRPVVLMSSGRAALLACFRHLGLNRYGSRLAMPPRTAQCVFDAVTRAAFPVDPASDGGPVDATLLIHQYGHLLHDRPAGPVIEDICHAFFARPDSGARDWAGELAVFSLPKFFPVAGMAGGIVAADDALADALRAARDTAPRLSDAQLAADRASWRGGESAALELAYLRALLHPAASADALAGLPDDLAAVGARRADVTATLLDAIPPASLDNAWRAMCGQALPFALPVFAAPDDLARLVESLRAMHVETGLFRIDRARKMAKPDPQIAALVPCHHAMGEAEVQATADRLRAWGATLPGSGRNGRGDPA